MLTATEYELLRALAVNSGRVTSFDTLLRRVWVSKVRHQLFQPGILLLQGLEPFSLAHPQTSVLFSPSVVGLPGHTDLLTHLDDALPLDQDHLRLSKLPNNLLCSVSFPQMVGSVSMFTIQRGGTASQNPIPQSSSRVPQSKSGCARV